MFNFAKVVTEYEMQDSKTKSPDRVLKHQQSEKVLLTANPIQLMFIRCLLGERIKREQDVGGHSKTSDVLPVLRESRHTWGSLFITTITTIAMTTIT